MSELIDKEALITKLLTLPGVGSNSEALETIKCFPTYEPQKPVVPPELAEYIQENEGESIGDVFSHEWLTHYDNQQLGDKVAKWLFDNDREENNRRYLIAVQAFIKGDYEVEKKPKYVVKIGKLYLKEPLGDTSDSTILTTWDKKYAYPFSSFHMADIHATKFEGAVIEGAER